MNTLFIRRLVVWAVGMLTGVIVSWLVITFLLPLASPDPNATPVSIQQYGIIYFIVTAVPIGLIVVTVLDGLLNTRIWPD